MKKTISVYKPLGKTPLDCISELKTQFSELKDQKLAYAGRLDPMAEGLLLILVGDECKKREHYQMLSKRYTLSVLFGFETDTYDLLGKVTSSQKVDSDNVKSHLETVSAELLGIQDQLYPPYSSTRVNGKPLFYWARKNALSTIKIPSKKIEITETSLTDIKRISGQELLQSISTRIALVSGDFRQEEIITTWKNLLHKNKEDFLITTFTIASSQGAYMRSLAHELGKKLKQPACAYSITRTQIGDFSLEDAIRLF